ncbi:hypothetical protein [Pseudoalteromonas luteoviolacea]|uniref:Uncharacterized protein n=1 Tax=Pseudoalteromonas luteoviolacea S4060-1 TaxID=1365257 RepID=A0A167NZX5_9GAMM|nr:hypothetical protein [Pseudoalteromonas luteoviolacea]KZN38713.1 hypothetical protein N480_13745 [Pseudoalteromonas luteoviolacea S2607]KZN69209.1 hypothetical protein N478_11290 [Pseudoalteromonas luteoviolacea S4060-1]
MEESAPQQHSQIKKAALFSFKKLMALSVFTISIIIGAYATDIVETLKAYVLYSGSSVIRFLPIVLLSTTLVGYLYYRYEKSAESTFKRVFKSIFTVSVCIAFFTAGMFLKDPWFSLSMLSDEYSGPVRTFQNYAGFEVKQETCEKRGKSLTCSFYAINLLPKDNEFRIDSDSYAIDHKDSHAVAVAFYIGEKRYRINNFRNYDFFTVPVGSKRKFKLEFVLSSDEKMLLAPYLSVVMESRQHQEKHLNFRSVSVVDYIN